MSEYEWSYEMPTDVFFGLMAGGLVLMVAAAAVALVVRLMRTWQPKHRQRAVDDLARKMNLVVPEHVREPLARAIAVRKRGSEIGGIVSLGVLLLVLRPWQIPLPDLGLVGIVPVVVAGTASITLGAVIGGLFARRT